MCHQSVSWNSCTLLFVVSWLLYLIMPLIFFWGGEGKILFVCKCDKLGSTWHICTGITNIYMKSTNLVVKCSLMIFKKWNKACFLCIKIFNRKLFIYKQLKQTKFEHFTCKEFDFWSRDIITANKVFDQYYAQQIGRLHTSVPIKIRRGVYYSSMHIIQNQVRY